METNNLKTRSLKLTLGQARDWFKSGDFTLKTLALSVFSEDELVSSYKDIIDLVNTDSVTVQVPKELTNRIIVYSKLLIASEYFNSIHRYKNEHWFIGELANPYYNPSNINKYNGFTLVKHQKATYAGIIYFNCLTDLEKTIDMLGDDLKYLL